MQANTEVSEDSSQDNLHAVQNVSESSFCLFIILALGALLIWIVYVASLEPSNEEGERRRKKKGTFGQEIGHKKTNNIKINGDQRRSYEILYESAPAPSFMRSLRCDGQGTSRGRINLQLVPGPKVVVRPRTSIGQSQTNATDHSSQVRMEGDEEIDEEEAVCKFCFDILKEDENILKTECGCKNALVHEECAANQTRVRGNNTCDYCGQEVRSFPVTLLRGPGSTQRMDTQESNKKSWISRLMRKSK